MAEELKNENQEQENSGIEAQEDKPEVSVAGAKGDAGKEVDVQSQIQALLIENAKLKRATDKASSEAADFKKKWKASLSEVEQASVEKAEREAEREEQFQALLRENKINKAEKQYLAMGYSVNEASKMAVAEIDNDFDAKIKIMAEVDARKKKEYEAEWLKSRPAVNAGVGNENAPLTKEQFDKLGYKEIVDFKNKYPETYKSYTQK